jgi:hypothetical protein
MFLLLFFLSSTKREENEGDAMAKGMNDINLSTCFVYILLRVGVPPPKLGLKHKFYWYLYEIVVIIVHIFITTMYPIFIICRQFKVMQKIIPKLSLTFSCRKIAKF